MAGHHNLVIAIQKNKNTKNLDIKFVHNFQHSNTHAHTYEKYI